MKTLKCSLLVVLVTGLGVLTIMLLTRSPRPLDMDANEATEANERNQAVEQNEAVVYQPAPLATVPVRKPASVVPLTPDKTDVPVADIASQPANVLRVRADQVLAKVNDQAILLADLVPLRADEQEQAMTSEEVPIAPEPGHRDGVDLPGRRGPRGGLDARTKAASGWRCAKA